MIQVKDIEALKAAMGFVNTNSVHTRYNSMNGVRITTDGTVIATDGHLLFVCPEVTEPIPGAITVEFTRKMPSKINTATIDLDRLVINYEKSLTDKSSDTIKISEGEFPDWKKCILDPWPEVAGPMAVSTTVLNKLLKALGTRGHESIRFHPSGHNPIKVDFEPLLYATIILRPIRWN